MNTLYLNEYQLTNKKVMIMENKSNEIKIPVIIGDYLIMHIELAYVTRKGFLD